MKLKFIKENLSKIVLVVAFLVILGGTVGGNMYSKYKEDTEAKIYDIKEMLSDFNYDEEDSDYSKSSIKSAIKELPKNQQEKYQKKLDVVVESNNFKSEMKELAYDKDEDKNFDSEDEITNDALMFKYDVVEERYKEVLESYKNLSKEAKKKVAYDYKELVKAHDYAVSKDSKLHPSYYLFYNYSKEEVEKLSKELEEINPSSYPDFYGVSEFQSMVRDRLKYLNADSIDGVYSAKSVQDLINTMENYDSSLNLGEPTLYKDIQIYDSKSNRDVYIYNVDGMLIGTDDTGYHLMALSDVNTTSSKHKALRETLKNSNIYFSANRNSEDKFQTIYSLHEAKDNKSSIYYLSENAMIVK